MSDEITVKLTFPKPSSDEAVADAVQGMVASLPRQSGNVKIVIEGASDKLAAAFEAAFAIGRAQIAARRSRNSK